MSWVNNPLSSPGSISVRLNNTWTVILLLVFGIVAFWLQTYKNPISCLTPKDFSPAYVLWTHNQCWYARRMYVEKKEDFLFYGEPGLPTVFQDDYREYSGSSDRLNDPRRTSLIVYQWIPVMILFQALLFKLPDLVWKGGLATLGISPDNMLGCRKTYENTTKSERKHIGRQMAGYLFHYLQSGTLKGCPFGPLTLLYIFVKVLYLVNVITQFAMMQKYLPEDNPNNALPWVDVNTTGVNVTGPPIFPKTVMCAFLIRFLQNVQRYQVVCNIPINYWYHLIVEAVRVWLLIVMIPTVLSCLIDAVKVVIPYFRQSFMSCYLSSMDRDRPQPNNTEVNLFASYMGQDIVILLKLIGNHTSEILVGDTVIGLWDIHHGSPPGVAGSYVPQTLPSAPGHGAHYDGKVEYASAPGENVPLVNVGGGGNLYPKA